MRPALRYFLYGVSLGLAFCLGYAAAPAVIVLRWSPPPHARCIWPGDSTQYPQCWWYAPETTGRGPILSSR